MKRIKRFFKILLLSLTYPQRLSEAVERAHSCSDLDAALDGGEL